MGEEVMDQNIKSEVVTATQDKDTNVPCDQENHTSSPAPVILMVDDSEQVEYRKAMLNQIVVENKAIEAPIITEISSIKEVVGENDFGELGHTEEVEKAVKAVAEHVPMHFHPVLGRDLKRHPHKRAISKEQRKELRDQGKAWWLK
jgi:hypothetical protein